jgi:hypothetical protein
MKYEANLSTPDHFRIDRKVTNFIEVFCDFGDEKCGRRTWTYSYGCALPVIYAKARIEKRLGNFMCSIWLQ